MKLACCLYWPITVPEGVEMSPLVHTVYASEVILKTGFDACEMSAQSAHGFSDEDIAKIKEKKISFASANIFIPGNLKIYGFGKELEDYVEKNLRILSSLGIPCVVFGSGTARQRPDGVSEADHKNEICRFLRMCSVYAERYGVDVVIEPLNYKECNVLNTVKEAYDLAKELNLPGIRVLADIYHMYQNGETPDILFEAKDLLSHVHVADPETRSYPGVTDSAYLCDFMKVLRDIGYSGTVSIECNGFPYAEHLEDAYRYMRSLM